VKTRSGITHGRPAESVNFRKRARIARAALAYLARRDWLLRPSRFDVVEVVLDAASGEIRVSHIRDAFRPGLRG
jgi:putative endonuclease